MTALWSALLISAVGCYVLKLAGVSLPDSVLNQPRVQRVAALMPVGMLAALVAVQLLDDGGRYAVDVPLLVGVGVAALALVLRQGFLVVFLLGVVVTGVLRAFIG